MAKLKIGDVGKTDSGFWPTYRIVAAHADGRLICELMSASGVPHLCTIKHPGMAAGIKLLPPTPKVLTMRRWLWMEQSDGGHSTPYESSARMPGTVARPADYTYTPDGRIVSITFLDEATEPKSLDLQVGDVVRLRNGDEATINGKFSSGSFWHYADDGRRLSWWPSGSYWHDAQSKFDIVEVVKRAD